MTPEQTANPFATLLDGVRRYSYHDYDEDDGFCLREKDVLAALAAAVPADLAEAGKVLEGVTPGPWVAYGEPEVGLPSSLFSGKIGEFGFGPIEPLQGADLHFVAWCREGVPALLARLAAQEAKMKGLKAERDEPHWDDHCVNQFAKMMREKMAAARAKGRSGWDDPIQCSVDYLRDLLYEHLDKGDPVDVVNFCMMLRHYDASTRRDYGNTLDMWKARAEAAETALAAMTKERDAAEAELVGAFEAAAEAVEELSKAPGTTWGQVKGHVRAMGDVGDRRAYQSMRAALAAEQAKVAKLVEALKRWEHSGCPDCGGDCASANPPVSLCIMRETRAAITEAGQ